MELPSAFSLFKPSFNAVLLNSWTFLGLALTPFALYVLILLMAVSVKNMELGRPVGGLVVLFGLLGMGLILLISPSITYLQLKSAQDVEMTLGEALRAGVKYFWRFYGLSVLVALVVLGGFVLLIVPGFFMVKRYYLSQFYLLDRNVGIFEAMRLSAADSKRFSGGIWGLMGVVILIGMPAIIPLFIPVSAFLGVVYLCAPAIRYLQIKQATKHDGKS